MNKWERRMFKIYGPITDRGILIILTNYELWELHKTGNLVADIKKISLKQLEHVIRMHQSRVPKKNFESSSEGKIKVGK